MKLVGIRAAAIAAATTLTFASLSAQGRGAAPPNTPPPTPRAAALFDITGYWVSLVTEDWRYRQFTPAKGDYVSVPVNPEGKKVADSWDAAKDEAAGDQCKAYGAAGLMRMPTRLHVTWENDQTLKVETDAGEQVRRLVFDSAAPPPAQKSLQGFSRAQWERNGGGRGAPGGGAVGQILNPRSGDLKVVTTNLAAAWLRRNGAPYSDQTTMTEYFDRFATPAGEEWLVVTTIVSDPRYLNQDFVTSTHFRREPNGAKWDPTPCRGTT